MCTSPTGFFEDIMNESITDGYQSALKLVRGGSTRLAKLKRLSYIDAVMAGDDIVTEIVMERGMRNVNEKNSKGRTPLMLAAERGKSEVTKLLLSAGADPSIEEPESNWTAICFAASGGSVKCIQQLLLAKNNTSTTVAGGVTPLHIAAATGSPEIVKTLLLAGAKLTSDLNNNTPLHCVVASPCGLTDIEINKKMVCSVLLQSSPGSARTQTLTNGETAAHVAVRSNLVSCLDVMLQCDPTLISIKDNSGKSLFLTACCVGSIDCLEYQGLYTQPESMNNFKSTITTDTDHCGDSCLHHAARHNRSSVVKFLLNHSEVTDDIRIVLLNSTNTWNESPLFVACTGNCRDVVLEMIRFGSLLNINLARKESNLEVIHTAASCSSDCLEALLKCNAFDIDVQSAAVGNLLTPLHCAALSSNKTSAAILLKYCPAASVNVFDCEGNSPLHVSVMCLCQPLFELLIKSIGLSSSTIEAVNIEGNSIENLLQNKSHDPTNTEKELSTISTMQTLLHENYVRVTEEDEQIERFSIGEREVKFRLDLSNEKLNSFNEIALVDEIKGLFCRTFPYSRLRLPESDLTADHINVAFREMYLSDAEFLELFEVEKDRFKLWTHHRKDSKKIELSLAEQVT